MTWTRHALTDHDYEAMTVTCSTCGPGARLWNPTRKGKKVWRCHGTRNKGGPAKPETYLAYRYRKYGLTLEQFEALVAQANGRCMLCHREAEAEAPGRDRLAIDHCHETGRVRGLLCGTCNRGLGLLGDNVEGLEKALAYLRKAPAL